MDTALLEMAGPGRRNKAWAESMVNLEARKLVSTLWDSKTSQGLLYIMPFH